MRELRIAAIGFTCAWLGGCATQYYSVQPVTLADQRQQVVSGEPTIWQTKGQGTVAVTPLSAAGGRVWFEVVVANHGDSRVLFDPDKLKFTDGTNKNVRTYSAHELEAQVDSESARESFFAGLGGAIREMSADASTATTTTTTYNGAVTLGARGGEVPQTASISGTATSVTYNPEKAEAERQAARKDTESRLAEIADQRDQGERTIQNEVLRPMFVLPGQNYGGRIEIDMPKGKQDLRQVSLDTEWNGQSYRFDFNFTPIK